MLIKFKRPLTVYLDNDLEFTFRDGFSYESNNVDDGIIVWNIDKSVVVEFDMEDVEKWCGE